QHQQGSVEQVGRRLNQARDFFRTQYDRQLLRSLQQRQIVEVQIAPLQGLLVEKPQRAHAQRDRSDSQLLLLQQMQLKLADLFGAHQLRGLTEVAGELLHGQNVAANRVDGIVASLEFLQHGGQDQASGVPVPDPQ